jgi:hypothetical protein
MTENQMIMIFSRIYFQLMNKKAALCIVVNTFNVATLINNFITFVAAALTN